MENGQYELVIVLAIDRIEKAPFHHCIFEILASLAGLDQCQHIGD